MGEKQEAQKSSRAEIDALFAKPKEKRDDAPQGRKEEQSNAPRKPLRKKRKGEGSSADPLGRAEQWIDDGLGGVYDSKGWTGRKTEGDNLKIYKAHLLKV